MKIDRIILALDVNKGRGVCCPVCGMVHVKYTLLLIGKSSPSIAAAGFLSHYLIGLWPYVNAILP